MDQWQIHLPISMDYDCARPGAHVLHVALARLLRQEVNKARGSHGITALMDLSTFYDCIDLKTLAAAAQELKYPALPLWFALQTALYVSAQARTPDQPGAEPHLRRRQRDAGLTAWERANEPHDKSKLDEDHQQAYQYAVERITAIYKDPAHYIHDKPKRSQATNTKKYKKRLVHKCTEPPTEEGRRWTKHRSGYQCAHCSARIAQGLTAATIEQRLAEPCEGKRNLPPADGENETPDRKIPKRATRTQLIQELLAAQPPERQEGKHWFIETAGYIKCQHCGCAIT